MTKPLGCRTAVVHAAGRVAGIGGPRPAVHSAHWTVPIVTAQPVETGPPWLTRTDHSLVLDRGDITIRVVKPEPGP